jgi:dynein light intermediate chain 2
MSETPQAEALSLPGTGMSAEGSKPAIKIDHTKDLWQNIALNVKDSTTDASDKTVFIVGSKGAGKSTIVNRLLGSTVKAKPSTALEYRCWKKDERGGMQLAHLWELAQGEQLSSLADVVITAENIHTVSVLIVVDCGDPSSVWETCSKWLKRIDRRVEEVYQKMRSKSSTTPDKLVERAKAKIGLDHPDLAKMRISGLPTVIVANRIDAFKGDTTRLKLIAKALRFVAHMYGASLIFTSDKTEDVKKLCSIAESAVFQQKKFDEDRFVNFEPERGPVLVTPTKDMFRQIGDAPLTNFNDFVGTSDPELDRWKAPFDEAFVPKGKSSASAAASGGSNNDDAFFLKKLYDTGADGFGEPAVDSVRKLKDEELEQYRRTSAKKATEKSEGSAA